MKNKIKQQIFDPKKNINKAINKQYWSKMSMDLNIEISTQLSVLYIGLDFIEKIKEKVQKDTKHISLNYSEN